jgi:hypothetical protein
MKYLYYLTILSLTFFSFSPEKECRNSNFGANLQTVKLNETAEFIKEEFLLHNLKTLIFLEHKPGASYLYTYTFHAEKLTSLKIKKISISGDNSYMNADDNYKEVKNRYSLNCTIKLTEKVDNTGLKSFQLNSTKGKILVMVVQEDHDFYMVERISSK